MDLWAAALIMECPSSCDSRYAHHGDKTGFTGRCTCCPQAQLSRFTKCSSSSTSKEAFLGFPARLRPQLSLASPARAGSEGTGSPRGGGTQDRLPFPIPDPTSGLVGRVKDNGPESRPEAGQRDTKDSNRPL